VDSLLPLKVIKVGETPLQKAKILDKDEPKQKSSSIIDTLPGNSIVSKVGYLTGATGLATFLISKEIYILNEETLVLVASAGLLGVLLKYLREPFTNMADEHVAVSINKGCDMTRGTLFLMLFCVL
jgi:F-type H+-transporting ATPase subunit b